MQRELKTPRVPCAEIPWVAATVLFVALMAVAGERALAPWAANVPRDRTAADAAVTQAAYRNAAGPAAEPDAAPQTQPDL